MYKQNNKQMRPLSVIAITLLVFATILTSGSPQNRWTSWVQPTTHAQATTATLSGTVSDENDAAIAGASITATNDNTGLQRQATTNSSGMFTIPLLPPGKYSVSVKHDGFATAESKNIILEVGDLKSLPVHLRVGQIGESVMTIDGSSLIREDSAVGTVVNRQFVENLPLNGRSFQSLITMTPGVVITKADGTNQGQFSVNGQRANSNYFLVDGVSANIGVAPSFTPGQSGGGSIPGFAVTGGTNNLVSVDALQEFKIQTSTYAPEFGRTSGAQVSIVTRSGTNQYRGTLFEYFRNDALDANNWFANSRSANRPALRQNDFGGVLGGPIIKDRAFFFFSYEALRLRQPVFGITDVPSLISRRSAPTQLQSLLNAFPAPTGPDKGNGFAEFAASYSNPSTLNATSIRIDNSVTGKLTLFGRYNYAPSSTNQRGGSFSLNNLSSVMLNTQTITAGATMVITSSISNDSRINYSRVSGDSSFGIDEFGNAAIPGESTLFPAFASRQNSSFTLQLGGTNAGFQVGNLANNIQRQINIINNLSIVHGVHQLKLGIDYRRLFPDISPRAYAQSIAFSGITGASGTPTPGTVLSGMASSVSIFANSESRFPLFSNFSAYIQDVWKVRPRLTLTYGLRWEVNPPPSEQKGNDAFTVKGLNDPTTMTLAPRGTPLWRTAYDNFAPRIGVTYLLSQKHGRETIMRGGFGVFYDLGNGQATQAYGGGTFPFTARKVLPANTPLPLTMGQVEPPLLTSTPPVSFLVVFDPKLRIPYTLQWNFAVEQSLGINQTVSASYVGALGRRLLRQEQLSGRVLSGNPIFTASSSVFATKNTATSDYNALQLQYQRRLSQGLQALASYTWSKSIDIASDDSSSNTPAGKINPKQDRGPSDFDVRHYFSGAITYNIPAPNLDVVSSALLRNWSVDTIITARSATPVNVRYIGDIGFGLLLSLRPDLVQGVPLYLDDSSIAGGRRINRAAFRIPTELRQGTLGRNALRGFSMWQADFALRRQFKLAERLSLQIKSEFFNLFNHPNFGDPSGSLGTSFPGLVLPNNSFGQSIQSLGQSLGSGGGVNGGFNPLYQIGGPRSIPLSCKLQF